MFPPGQRGDCSSLEPHLTIWPRLRRSQRQRQRVVSFAVFPYLVVPRLGGARDRNPPPLPPLMMIHDWLRRHRQRGLFVSRAIAPQSLDAATRLFLSPRLCHVDGKKDEEGKAIGIKKYMRQRRRSARMPVWEIITGRVVEGAGVKPRRAGCFLWLRTRRQLKL